MRIQSKHVVHCQREGGRESKSSFKVTVCVALDNLAAPHTTVMQQQPGFPNYALLEGNIIPRQGQGGAI